MKCFQARDRLTESPSQLNCAQMLPRKEKFSCSPSAKKLMPESPRTMGAVGARQLLPTNSQIWRCMPVSTKISDWNSIKFMSVDH